MGWVNEYDPGHEGYVIALVERDYIGPEPLFVRSTYLHELTYWEQGDREIPDGLRPAAFQVACDCGWRSRRFHAPLRSRYHPHSLKLGRRRRRTKRARFGGSTAARTPRRAFAGDQAWLFPYRSGQ
jgi:hypothetical protein